MRFHKNVPQENREILTEQLKKYEKEMTMTSEERRELHKWVAKGHSPYDNGDFIYGENGWPMDFVSALRFVDDQLEWFESLSEEEQEALLHNNEPQYDTQMDEPVFCVAPYLCEVDLDEELPFR